MCNESIAEDHLCVIRETRSAAASALVQTLSGLPPCSSEAAIGANWQQVLSKNSRLFSEGWYQPPPKGVSVLIGNPPTYERLAFRSLRDRDAWPSEDIVLSRESILYPYFSVVNRSTLMIGDFVGSFYAGRDIAVREWMRAAMHCTRGIISKIHLGMPLRDVFYVAQEAIATLGAQNNTYSMSGGRASNIGHTVPFFGERAILDRIDDRGSGSSLAETISPARHFISAESERRIESPTAFTIEPQLLADGLPMVGFHFIVAFVNGHKFVVSEYDHMFQYYGMDEWVI